MNRPIDPAEIARIFRDGRACHRPIPPQAHDAAPRASDGVWLLWGLGGALLWLAGLAYLGAL